MTTFSPYFVVPRASVNSAGAVLGTVTFSENYSDHGYAVPGKYGNYIYTMDVWINGTPARDYIERKNWMTSAIDTIEVTGIINGSTIFSVGYVVLTESTGLYITQRYNYSGSPTMSEIWVYAVDWLALTITYLNMTSHASFLERTGVMTAYYNGVVRVVFVHSKDLPSGGIGFDFIVYNTFYDTFALLLGPSGDTAAYNYDIAQWDEGGGSVMAYPFTYTDIGNGMIGCMCPRSSAFGIDPFVTKTWIIMLDTENETIVYTDLPMGVHNVPAQAGDYYTFIYFRQSYGWQVCPTVSGDAFYFMVQKYLWVSGSQYNASGFWIMKMEANGTITTIKDFTNTGSDEYYPYGFVYSGTKIIAWFEHIYPSSSVFIDFYDMTLDTLAFAKSTSAYYINSFRVAQNLSTPNNVIISFRQVRDVAPYDYIIEYIELDGTATEVLNFGSLTQPPWVRLLGNIIFWYRSRFTLYIHYMAEATTTTKRLQAIFWN